jgi:hypothetical protein
MHPVEFAIWLIESRLAEGPTLDDEWMTSKVYLTLKP